jgi:hypothetical protein
LKFVILVASKGNHHLKAYSHPEHWTQALPLVLLGIQTSMKEDIGCTAAELVYGTTLRLPGEFFIASTSNCSDPNSYVAQLRAHFRGSHYSLDYWTTGLDYWTDP